MMPIMRTTLTIDNDILLALKRLTTKLQRPLKALVNETLRLGLKQIAKSRAVRPYQTRGRAMGLRAGYSLDNIQALLTDLDEAESP